MYVTLVMNDKVCYENIFRLLSLLVLMKFVAYLVRIGLITALSTRLVFLVERAAIYDPFYRQVLVQFSFKPRGTNFIHIGKSSRL